jgi:hypothetical protein
MAENQNLTRTVGEKTLSQIPTISVEFYKAMLETCHPLPSTESRQFTKNLDLAGVGEDMQHKECHMHMYSPLIVLSNQHSVHNYHLPSHATYLTYHIFLGLIIFIFCKEYKLRNSLSCISLHSNTDMPRQADVSFGIVVEVLCYKPEGCGFETRWGNLILSIYQIRLAVLSLVVYQPLTKVRTRARPMHEVDNLTAICESNA